MLFSLSVSSESASSTCFDAVASRAYKIKEEITYFQLVIPVEIPGLEKMKEATILSWSSASHTLWTLYDSRIQQGCLLSLREF